MVSVSRAVPLGTTAVRTWHASAHYISKPLRGMRTIIISVFPVERWDAVIFTTEQVGSELYPQHPHSTPASAPALNLLWSPGFISFNPGEPFPTILPPTLGNVTEELELHWQAEQAVHEWDLDALHAPLMLFIEPAVAAEYGLIHYIYSKKDRGVWASQALAWPQSLPHPCPAQGHSSREHRILAFSSYTICVDRESLALEVPGPRAFVPGAVSMSLSSGE